MKRKYQRHDRLLVRRFAAKKAGFYPRDNDEEALKIDEVS